MGGGNALASLFEWCQISPKVGTRLDNRQAGNWVGGAQMVDPGGDKVAGGFVRRTTQAFG